MDKKIQDALIIGVERIAAWSDLLDDINVFPVADGDTGRNLTTSLSPLRELAKDRENTIRKLLFSARGNSGNIAALFFSGLLTADSVENLPAASKLGRDRAWQAINDPVPGTMLDVLDALAETMEKNDINENDQNASKIIHNLENAVRSTHELLPKLKDAGVVDSGALGMFIFLEGFLKSLTDSADQFQPVTDLFEGLLHVSSSFRERQEEGYCIDMVVRFDDRPEDQIQRLSEHGDSVVVIPHDDFFKVHLHTTNRAEAKKGIESLCQVVQWSDDDLEKQVADFKRYDTHRCIHIMTDAAGSITREDSRNMGITLLDSYITAGDRSLPETLFLPSELYKYMRGGIKVSSSQASIFERHQYYQNILNQYERALYLCVGSYYTGNYDVATKWKSENDPDDRFTVIDTGAASGRLGMIVTATARYAPDRDDADSVIDFARAAVDVCEEYVFLDKLQYLAAGGRLSKSSAFFGDLLHMKPVISPLAEGAKKVGVLRNQKDQVRFALEKLDIAFSKDSKFFVLLQYTDNKPWVSDVVLKKIEELYPSAEIILQPLSLTSGVHMGPGTWAIAFIPDLITLFDN